MLPTEDLLIRAFTITEGRARRFAEPLRETCQLFTITTPARLASFLATIGHESGRLRYTREIWGPTPAQRRYEGREDLGNTELGDGVRFLGRGLMQNTGRGGYALVRDRLRQRMKGVPDFVAEPQLLEEPRWAALAAGAFWSAHLLNQLADRGEFLRISIIVNGRNADGLPNGWDDRQALYRAAKAALSI